MVISLGVGENIRHVLDLSLIDGHDFAKYVRAYKSLSHFLPDFVRNQMSIPTHIAEQAVNSIDSIFIVIPPIFILIFYFQCRLKAL